MGCKRRKRKKRGFRAVITDPVWRAEREQRRLRRRALDARRMLKLFRMFD